MQEIDKEKLRAFEQKMHDEGADGFADGPRPWETWDESGAQAGNGRHIWEGKARRIYKNTRVQRSLGERILSGLAMMAMATMVVGIAGVYLTEEQPRTVAWTAIKPTPIPLPGQGDTTDRQRLPARLERSAPVITAIEALPPPAAGSVPPAAETPGAAADAGHQWQAITGHDSETASIGGPLQDPEAAPDAESVAAAMPAADPHIDSGDSGTDLEIFAAPTALLLTSLTTASPADSDQAGLELEPELSLEVATAPAVDSEPYIAPGTASGQAATETGAGTGIAPVVAEDKILVAEAPASNRINRGNASHATAVSAPPQTRTSTTGSATAAELAARAESTVADSGAAQPATPQENDVTAEQDAGSEARVAADIAMAENLPPAAVDTATTSADTSSSGAPAEAAEIPADGDVQVQDTAAQTGGNSRSGKDNVVALAGPEPVAAAPSPAVAAAAPAGDWVVNLASYNHKAMAKRKLGEFQAKGVNAEIESTMIKDRPMYRIRVTGFESSRAARASIGSLEKTLGLKGVWISRRQEPVN